MQVTETSNEGLKREYTVIIPKEDIDGRMSERLTEVGTTVNVPGFRPGKVPLAILKKRFGDAVRGEILEKTIQDSIQNTMDEKDLRPAMEPKVDLVTFEDGTDLEYKLTVEVIPDIEPIDFGTIELERLIADVPDDDVQTSMERLAEQQKTYAEEEGRAAEEQSQRNPLLQLESGEVVSSNRPGRVGPQTSRPFGASPLGLKNASILISISYVFLASSTDKFWLQT